MKRFFIIAAILFPFMASAIVNDSSCSAAFLDTLNYPIFCGSNNATTYTFSFDNGTANAEVNQPSILNCRGTGTDMNTPSPDSWYYFFAASTSLTVQMSPGTNIINTPQLGFYEFRQNCNALIPRGCAIGSNGSLTATFHNLIPGSVYMLQIGGGGPTDKGDGTVTLSSFRKCNNCVNLTYLEADPKPTQGTYPPGTKVEFCFGVNGYKKSTSTALHGVVPDFGLGWDISSFQHVASTNTNDGTGKWGLFQNITTPIGTKRGYFYDQYPLDGIPSNNLGDSGDSSAIWFFCFTIKTKAPTNCTNKGDLAINFHTFSDAQTGSNSGGAACAGDTALQFRAFSNCCTPIEISSQNETCLDSCDGQAIATVTGIGPWVFRWKDPAGNIIRKQTYASSTTASDTLYDLCDNIYTVHVTDLGPNPSCTGYQSFEIEPPKKHWVYVSDTACIGSCNGKAKVSPIIGVPPYTYQWDDPNNQTTQEATGLCPGFYNVVVTDANGCAAKHEVYVFELPPGNASFSYSKFNYCTNSPNETPAVIIMPGGTFSSTPSGLSLNASTGEIVFSQSDTGLYNIRYITNTPCPDTAFTQIFISPTPPLPTVDKNKLMLCSSDSTYFIHGTPDSYHFLKWYEDTSSSPVLVNRDTFYIPGNLGPGTHMYYVSQMDSDLTCESNFRPIEVTVGGSGVDAGEDIITCPAYSVMLNATGNGSFNWSPGHLLSDSTVANPELVAEEDRFFYVTLTDSSGCSSTDSVRVVLKPEGNCELKIYSGFTPNGDGVNDTWIIDGIGSFPGNTVKIYSRWGKVVWETKNYDNKENVWKGDNRDLDLLPDGTYFYEILLDGKKHAGWVELTR